MKKYFFLILVAVALSCNKDSMVSNNPYLQNVSFSYLINLNLPANNQLNYVGSPMLITSAGAGISGIIVMKAGASSNDYRAFEASCPNQYVSPCSQLTLNGINAVCSCDEYEYSLFTGLPVTSGVQYPLKQYRVEVSGANVRVYN